MPAIWDSVQHGSNGSLHRKRQPLLLQCRTKCGREWTGVYPQRPFGWHIVWMSRSAYCFEDDGQEPVL